MPLTFRSGGTSLSGQAVTDGILVDTRRHFRGIEVLDDGARVRVGPGATVRQVNARLAAARAQARPRPGQRGRLHDRRGRRQQLQRHGLRHRGQHLPHARVARRSCCRSGTVVDTGAPDADARLRARSNPSCTRASPGCATELRGNPVLRAKIEQQFSMKNTMGYGLNSFLDHDPPGRHPRPPGGRQRGHAGVHRRGRLPHRAAAARTPRTGLLVFDDLAAATGALPALVDAGPATIELLDATSLRVGQTDPQADARAARPVGATSTPPCSSSTRARRPATLDERVAAAARRARRACRSPAPRTLARRPRAPGRAVAHPQGPLRGGRRAPARRGTTALLEDIVVPVPALLPTCERLTALFDRHGYARQRDLRARQGRQHPLHAHRAARRRRPARPLLAASPRTWSSSSSASGGSLKAEHGTGRIMAPFVRRQYGDELYEVMREIKRLLRPARHAQPGRAAHRRPRRAPARPQADPDRSRPRSTGASSAATASRSARARTSPPRRGSGSCCAARCSGAEAAGDTALRRASSRTSTSYDAHRHLRGRRHVPDRLPGADQHRRPGQAAARRSRRAAVRARCWTAAARHWAGATRAAAAALTVAAGLPVAAGRRARPALGRKVIDDGRAARVVAGPAPRRRPGARARPRNAPTRCTSRPASARCSGPPTAARGAADAFAALCERAGGRADLARTGSPSLCCGTPWKSKGMRRGYDEMTARVLPALWAATRRGRAAGRRATRRRAPRGCGRCWRRRAEPYAKIRVVDAVAFTAETLLPRLTVTAPLRVGGAAPHLLVHPAGARPTRCAGSPRRSPTP